MELFSQERQSSPFAITEDLLAFYCLRYGLDMESALRLLKADAKQIIRMRKERNADNRNRQ